MPPFRREGRQFNQQENLQGYLVASVRIHVERAIARLKFFGILDFIEHHLYKHIDQILMVLAFLCNCGNDLIGKPKPKPDGSAPPNVQAAPSDVEQSRNENENDSVQVVCDLDEPHEDEQEDIDDLDLEFLNLQGNEKNFFDNISSDEEIDGIEQIVNKTKVSKEEVVAILDDIDANLVQNDNVSVNIVTSTDAAASASASPKMTSRSGRKLKKNPKYSE